MVLYPSRYVKPIPCEVNHWVCLRAHRCCIFRVEKTNLKKLESGRPEIHSKKSKMVGRTTFLVKNEMKLMDVQSPRKAADSTCVATLKQINVDQCNTRAIIMLPNHMTGLACGSSRQLVRQHDRAVEFRVQIKKLAPAYTMKERSDKTVTRYISWAYTLAHRLSRS